jgi:hypothetical protein
MAQTGQFVYQRGLSSARANVSRMGRRGSVRVCGSGEPAAATTGDQPAGGLARLEDETKERMRQGHQKVDDPGQALDKAAAMFLANRQYVSDAKRIGERDSPAINSAYLAQGAR